VSLELQGEGLEFARRLRLWYCWCPEPQGGRAKHLQPSGAKRNQRSDLPRWSKGPTGVTFPSPLFGSRFETQASACCSSLALPSWRQSAFRAFSGTGDSGPRKARYFMPKPGACGLIRR